MTINPSDIKLLESERMTDTSDGGGRRTSRVIADASPGNIFPKVSRLDSVYGRDNLRKIFAHVDTANVDVYAGAHAAIIDAPDNARIGVTMFTTSSDFDDRTAARDRIESYVIAGPVSRMQIYGRQLVNQQAVAFVQRVEEVLPEVGGVLCLSNEPGGVVSSQQFIRIAEVSHEIRTFTDNLGDYQRRVITVKTDAPLRYEFDGADTPPRFSGATGAIVRNTNVADAARYYGIQPLSQAALAQDLEVRVASIYAPIVPSNLRETPVSNASIGGVTALQAIAPTATAFTAVGAQMVGNVVTTQTISVGSSIKPGTLQLRVDVDPGHIVSVPSGVVTDDGKGGIPVGAILNGNQIRGGTVDYENGLITVSSTFTTPNQNNPGGYPAHIQASYIPAVAVSQPAHLKEIPITLATRGSVYVASLNPLPARGTVFFDFRALGKWYRLQDDGSGVMAGADPAYGTGTIDFATGGLIVTLGAQPDVGSSCIVGWASPTHYAVRAGATADITGKLTQQFTLQQLPVTPGSLTIAYTAGATVNTAAADVAGNITGGGLTGTVNHTTGEVSITYTSKIPNAGTGLTVNYNQAQPTNVAAPTTASGTATIASLAAASFPTMANLSPQGLRVGIPIYIPPAYGSQGAVVMIPAQEDGQGGLFTLAISATVQGMPYAHAGNTKVGTVDRASGQVAIDAGVDISVSRSVWVNVVSTTSGLSESGQWVMRATTYHPAAGDYPWTVRLANASTAAATTVTIAQADAGIKLDLTATAVDQVVPNSVSFVAFGRSYFDRNGTVYYNRQADGSGTAGGTINYATGRVTLTDYPNDTVPGITVAGCITKTGNFTTYGATFRTAGSPVRPASTVILVTADDGTVLTASCDTSGNITGPARGTVNQQFGLVSIQWGAMVAAAGNETQPWYSPANVVGTQVWQPRAVLPETIRYSTVVQSSLPVDADKLGLDPVRLPTDGRVPIYRGADVLLIHHTDLHDLPNPPGAGVTYYVGRSDLADLVLLDATGARVSANQYIVDLAAGTVTMAANMNLLGYTLPLRAKNRIEQLTMASDVQINGQIALAAPLSRDFPAGSMASSALLFGDLFARVTSVFDQVTWTNAWADARIGTDTPATYDTINYPIAVRNDGAVTERWRISFNTATAYQVIGEQLGIIASGTTAADCSPANPLTGLPYFTIKAAGFGAGWSAGNQLRFNTIGATGAIWLARTVLPGATLAGDSFDIQLRGDVDA